MPNARDILDRGETNNQLGSAALATKLGSVVSGEKAPVRLVRETLPVASAAATPSYAILALLFAKTTGTGAAGVKDPGILGATPGAGAAAPNAGGTSIVFNAETTGTGTVDAVYLTADPPKGAVSMLAELGGGFAG